MPISQIDLTDRFVNQPALIAPQLAERMKAELNESRRLSLLRSSADLDSQAAMFDRVFNGERPYKMVGSVAVIPITGSLLHRYNWSSSYATGYDFIKRMVDAAENDSGVKGIAFDIQSGGGQVDGAFECADVIASCSKPTRAVINAHAYSAAYLLASAADKRVIAQSGGAGSIGVVTMHVDMSKLLSDIGYDVTFIFAGDHKVDGNPYEPLPAKVKARYQDRIDQLYGMFTSTVAANTGLSVDAVVQTQADVFTADEALQLGLVDAIESPDKAIQAFVAEFSGETYGSITMSKENQPAAKPAAQAEGAGITQEAHDSAIAEAKAEGLKAGAAAERERFNKVMASEHFAGREKLAVKLLGNAAMDADSIVEALAEVPAANAGTPATNGFESAMDNGQQPGISAGGQPGGEQMSDADAILRDFGMASGQKLN